MQFSLDLEIPAWNQPITYKDSLFLIGSCFTGNMAERLAQHKFDIFLNPHGILFNPLSVTTSLIHYVSGKVYEEKDLFYLNELWNSWDHHTVFSDREKSRVLEKINERRKKASGFIRKARWIMITLGSAFQYYLKETGKPVANNHRAPAAWFDRRLLETGKVIESFSEALEKINSVNPGVQFLFTISPVRHAREGLIDNNRSKSRLIESVHELCSRFENCSYFPAYELIIDVLRDYRFYDIDMVHPNYLATEYVWERFVKAAVSEETKAIMKQIREISVAKAHRPRFPDTEAHRKFLKSYQEKTESLLRKYPSLNLKEELGYFSGKDQMTGF